MTQEGEAEWSIVADAVQPVFGGFGNLGGDYFVPDFNANQPNGPIWAVAPAGGPPTQFSTVPAGNAPETGTPSPPGCWSSKLIVARPPAVARRR